MEQNKDDVVVLFNMMVPKQILLDDEDFIPSFISKLEIIGIDAPDIKVIDYNDRDVESKIIIIQNYKINLILLRYVIDMLYPKKYTGIDLQKSLNITYNNNDTNITFICNSIIKKCSSYLTKLKSALDTFKMMVKRNMIDMN